MLTTRQILKSTAAAAAAVVSAATLFFAGAGAAMAPEAGRLNSNSPWRQTPMPGATRSTWSRSAHVRLLPLDRMDGGVRVHVLRRVPVLALRAARRREAARIHRHERVLVALHRVLTGVPGDDHCNAATG